MNWSEPELAWLAGLLEGEACFQMNKSPVINLQMTDEDIISRVAKMWGCPYRSRKRARAEWKQVFYVYVCGAQAMEIMRLIKPYMGNRRSAKIDEVLARAAARPGLARGARQGAAKLNDDKARAIVKAYRDNPAQGAQVALAEEYKVSQATIWYIINGKTWNHATGLPKHSFAAG